MKREVKVEKQRRGLWMALGSMAAIGTLALLWKEFPAMVRYYKIERM
ncbi:hypothetical protein [Actinomadura sp. BRA 177]|nr:hypothetical protein [Actinomadura sp. BRA 177]NVI87793.1 hypothetical protein [Actinomadura sp. BRA 177]